MPHKGHDNKPTRKPQRIIRGQDGTTERRYGLQIYRDVAPVNATCYAIVAGQRQQSQRFSFSYSHSLSTSPSPAHVPRSRLLCSCHFYSYLLALAIPCCFSIIYVIDISTPSFRTVFRRQRLPPHTHTALAHTSIYSCNQLGTGSVRLAVDFIYCLRFAKSLPRPELRSSSFQR